MKVYLNATNQGYPLGSKAIQLIKDIGFSGVRTDIPNGMPKERIRAVVKELYEADLEAVYLVGGWQWWHIDHPVEDRMSRPMPDDVFNDAMLTSLEAYGRHKFYIQVGNEANFMPPYYTSKPKQFAQLVNKVKLGLRQENDLGLVDIISGGVSNINPKDGLDYALKVADTLSETTLLGIHPYRLDNVPWDPIRGKTIGSIVAKLRNAHRMLAITEGGWHTAPRSKKFPLCLFSESWNDKDVADFALYEIAFWRKYAELYCWYQLNDGPENTSEQRFGIRTLDGGRKLVADALQEWIKNHVPESN